jgi:uncharacterized membrane protein
LLIWGVVTIGFVVTFFMSGGAATYPDDAHRRLIGAIFLACGFFGSPVMLFLTRVRRGASRLVSDERDERIGRRAANGAMVVVLVYVFLSCIVLWETYEKQGSVPVGWMWFLAYSTAALSYLAPAAGTLILDLRMIGHGAD